MAKFLLWLGVLGLIVLGGLWFWFKDYRQQEEYAVEVLDTKQADLDAKAKRAKKSEEARKHPGWALPTGTSCTWAAVDYSSSLGKSQRKVAEESMLAVANATTGENLFGIVAFGTSVAMHGPSAEGPEGRRAVIKRWRDEWDEYSQRENRAYTNGSLMVRQLVDDMLARAKAGILCAAIILTDDLHDPPPGQLERKTQNGSFSPENRAPDLESELNPSPGAGADSLSAPLEVPEGEGFSQEEDYLWEIADQLSAVPDSMKTRLRFYVVRVRPDSTRAAKIHTTGHTISGHVLPQGWAIVRDADTWNDVLSIVKEIQAGLTGTFGFSADESYVDPLQIFERPLPEEDEPVELSGLPPFALTGLESARFKVALSGHEYWKESDRLICTIVVDGNEFPFHDGDEAIIPNGARISFRFAEDPEKSFSGNRFDEIRWPAKITLEPVGNLLPLSARHGSIEVVFWREKQWPWTLGQIVLVLAPICAGVLALAFWATGRSSRRYREQKERARFKPPVIIILPDGAKHQLGLGGSFNLGGAGLLIHRPAGVFLRPDQPLVVERKGEEKEFPGIDEEHQLPDNNVTVTNPLNDDTYRITNQSNQREEVES